MKKELRFLTSSEYARRRKQFVEVVAEHKIDGSILPKAVVFADGQRFDVELCRDPFSAILAEGDIQTVIYPIRHHKEHIESDPSPPDRSESYLFACAGRWYVLMKT
ncbi:MAG: hypothetical protein IKS55_05045 [Oscillospiraceae bacterium]|nr:hypothetical protein [Oscillospiraceae bacterium]